MNLYLIIRYVHIISILLLFGAVLAEWLLLQKVVSKKLLKRIAIFDAIYGISAITVLFAGLTMWLWVGKPAEYYNQNGWVYVKLGLFIIVGLLSIVPSIFIFKNNKGSDLDTNIDVPRSVRLMVGIEMILLCAIPIFAILMANGIAI